MEPILRVRVVSEYGKERYYPIAKDDFGFMLITLMKRCSFTREQIIFIKSCGFVVEYQTAKLGV